MVRVRDTLMVVVCRRCRRCSGVCHDNVSVFSGSDCRRGKRIVGIVGSLRHDGVSFIFRKRLVAIAIAVVVLRSREHDGT